MKPLFRITPLIVLLIAVSGMILAEDTDCASLLPARLVSGGQGRVLPPTPNNLREQPDADSSVVFQIPSDGTFEILGDAPVCADGYRWWHVRFTAFEGWTAEGDADGYWLAPAPTNGREIITGANASQLELLDTLGFGLIRSVAWDGDDLILRTSTGDWRYSTAQPERMPERLDDEAAPLETLIVGSTVRVIDTSTHLVRAALEHPAVVYDVAFFSLDYRYVVTNSEDGNIRLWNTHTGDLIDIIPGFDFFTSDGRHLGYLEYDDPNASRFEATLHLFELATMQESATQWVTEENGFPVGDATLSPDERILVTAGGNMMFGSLTVTAWEVSTGEKLVTLLDNPRDTWSIGFNQDGTKLGGASTHGEVTVWSVATWESQILIPGNVDIKHLEFSPDGIRVCYSDFYARRFTWDTVAQNMPIPSNQPCVLHAETASSTDGRYTAALDNGVLEVRERDRLVWSVADVSGNRVTFSPNGTLLMVTGEATYILDTATGANIASFPEQDWSSVAVFSPAGRRLVIGPHFDGWTFSSYPYNIIWDISRREVVATLSPIPEDAEAPHVYGIYDAAFNPTGDVLVTTSIGVAHLWDTRTWTLTAQIDDYQDVWGGEDVSTAAFSPDGTLLALGGGSAFESYSSQSVVRVYGVG